MNQHQADADRCARVREDCAVPTPAETGADVRTIFEEDSGAGELVIALMEHNRREAEKLDEWLRESAERDRDAWKERALFAEAELAAVRSNVSRLLHPSTENIERFLPDANYGSM